jgi:hypothetical protein
MTAESLDKSLKGVAGVHFVVAQLSLRGFVALPTTRNLKSFDVVAFQQDISKAVFLQVKSTDQPKSGWPVYTIPADENWQDHLRKSVSLGDSFFFIFVELPTGDKAEPSFYIVPSREVADMLIQDITGWLDKHKKSKPAKQLLAWSYGGPKYETKEKYQNKWGLLTHTQHSR